MKSKNLLFALVVALGGAAVALGVNAFFAKPQVIVQQVAGAPVAYTGYNGAGALDFTQAAEISLSGVVHVKTKAQQQQRQMTLFDFFYGNPYGQQQEQPVMGAGSGVIISPDGYIVTNNHVIEGSQEIEVVLHDNRVFAAQLVGTDPTTDIALLKVDAKDLPTLRWGDSDKIKVGEWVLAVGNPFNLTSTVTAGIVSAKGRSINIIDKKMAIESFIQTDAAVNPGNSGGALVNVSGELVGINTAIASRDGSFSGYSFAVPAGIAKKVVSDLLEFGQVQRAVMGVSIVTLNSDLAKKLKIDMIEGVLISEVASDGAAAQAGIEANDVVIKIDGERTKMSSNLQELIGRHRPGDVVRVTVLRNGREREFQVTLQNTFGSTALMKNDTQKILGAQLSPVADADKARLRIAHGLQVTSLSSGKLAKAGIQEGFIIVKMNDLFIDSAEDIQRAIQSARGGVMVKGIYPNGAVSYYAFGLDE